jgi:AcrR family transcriptional regulator
MAQSPESRPPNMRDQQRIFTRARLIEAAVQRFGQQGYHGTTIEDIVAGAGASRATFYLHFNSKLEILREAMVGMGPDVDRRYAQLDEALAKPGGVSREELSAWLDDWITFWQDNAALINAAHQAVAVEPGLVQQDWESRGRLADQLVHYLRPHRGAARKTARLRTLLLEGLTDRAFHLFINPEIELDRTQLVSVLTEFWWMVLHQPPPTPKPARRPRTGRRSSTS